MNVFVVRHGQTDWNAQHKVCGRTDVALTAKGIEQAKALAEDAVQLKIGRILSSPMQRAVQTAQIISDRCQVCYKIEPRLIEQDYGIFEGADRKNEEFLNHKKQFAFRYPQGESMMQVASRTYQLLNELKESGEDSVLLVCHGGVARVIHTYFADMTNEEFFQYNLPNGKCMQYEL